MRPLLVLTHRLDIPAVHQLAGQLPEAQPVVACPHLADRCAAEGLPVTLLRLRGDQVQPAYAEARRQARALQRQADAVLGLVEPLAPGADWLQQELFYLCYTALGYRALWRQLLEQQPDVPRWHVPVAEIPFRYGAHSCLPALALLEQLGATGRPMQAYSHPLAPTGPDPLPQLAGEGLDGDWPLLSHLPTCFYDHLHFEDVLVDHAAGRGERCLNLRAPYYDVELPRLTSTPLLPQDAVRATLPAARLDRIDTAAAALETAMQTALLPLIASPRYRLPQARALAEAWQRLLVFSAALAQRFDARPPRTLVLSNHDTGLHGPLLTLARRHRARVLLLPHSKIFNAPVPAVPGLDLHCLTHAVQGQPVQDVDGRRVSAHTLAFPEPLGWAARPPRPLQTMGVLLSGVSYNGLCGADLPRFVQGLRALRDWCTARGVRCRIRCKPSEPLVSLLTQDLGLETDELLADMAGSLSEFIQGCDIGLSYDVPTSATVELLRGGVPTLHVQLRPLLPEETALVDGALVPRLPVAELLSRLDLYRADAVHLWRFGRDQFQAFARSWATAEPLAGLL
ncbi:MAG: hypothetical protein JNL87_01640 [Burkholderiaceae bacterium]|nr:hypothetical protein [Burkholderiaceae bacterium]